MLIGTHMVTIVSGAEVETNAFLNTLEGKKFEYLVYYDIE